VANKSPRRIVVICAICLIGYSGLVTALVCGDKILQEETGRARCGNYLRLLGSGLHDFNARNRGLPPAYLCDEKGRPVHSWQTLLMPLIGYPRWCGAYSLKEPWDSPTNKRCQSLSFFGLHCPSASGDLRSNPDYVAVVGPDTMWPGRQRVALPREGEGGQDTVLLIELPDSDYRYLEPRFPTVDEFIERIKSPTGKGIRCIHRKGLAYLTVGGKVRWLPPDTDPETIRPLFKRDPSCKVIPPEEKIPIVEGWENQKDEH
jgi:hypothetical protein